tara:strand:- start:869 stop:1150 length:282 start_codon:yes stop_codon:yes gene_type:complete
MSDNRSNNGGHSTKAKGVDRRKNNYKEALNNAVSVEDVEKVLTALKIEAVTGEVPAMKLFLEYTLGKPTQTIEAETTHKVVSGLDLENLFAKK